MVQFSIVGGSLKIDNENLTTIVLIAKKDVSCYSNFLYLDIPVIYLYNLNGGFNEVVFQLPLSECKDDTGTPFTVNSFILFAEANLGFNTGAIPQTISVVSVFSSLPSPATVSGEFYWCENTEGTNFTGLYYSNGVIWEKSLGFTPEDVANKSDSYTASSTTTYPNTKALVDGLATKQASLGFNPYRYVNTTSSSTLTGTLTETQLLQVTIPANTFSSSDLLKFSADFVKIGTLGTATIKIKISTSATMPAGGGAQVATMQMGTTILFSPYSRRFSIKSGNIVGYVNTGSSISEIQTSAAISSQAFDPTVTNYFYVSGTLSNILDSVYMNSIQIINI
jgi:hypothetical protein